jgi:predicted acetyltransferase
MSDVVIRRVEGEEILETAARLIDYSLRSSPPKRTADEGRASLAFMEKNTVLVLFEDGKPMATAFSIPMPHTVRGKIYKMGGIAGVASHPNGRRKGYAYGVVTKLLEADRESGYAFSGLYPFRESFYGRLGFVTYPQVKVTRFSPAQLAPVLRTDFGGEVEFLPHSEGLNAYIVFLEQHQPKVHGMARYSPEQEAYRFDRSPVWIALARVDGEVVGVMTYKIVEFGGDLTSYYFYYRDPRGRYLLLQWLARHVDQVKEVELTLPPYEMPETWLPDLNVKIKTTDWVTPMARVLDVARIDGMHTGEGQFTARMIDPQCAWNNGVFRFETQDGLLSVSPASNADCELTINGLSALIYGTHDPEEFAFRGWGNPSVETQTVMRGMFPRMLAHMHAPY